jgi:hypothetical protein
MTATKLRELIKHETLSLQEFRCVTQDQFVKLREAVVSRTERLFGACYALELIRQVANYEFEMALQIVAERENA